MNLKKKNHDFRGIALCLVPYFIAAIASAVIVMIMYIQKGIAPFGENSVLCMDLWGQYFPMYVNNKQAEGLSGLFYSWNGAFGFNNWAQSAYYCNSIFVFLLRFFSDASLVKALDIFCFLKIVLSSVCCLGYLQYKFQKRSPILIAGAVCYSVCAYMLAFLSQCMWTDSLFLAPLVLIGLERLVQKQKPLMYTLMLAILIMSSFYIGFAMCIFCVLYFLYISIPETICMQGSLKSRTKHFGQAVLRFGGFSILAGAISAVVIIPVAYAISNTLASEVPGPEAFKWYGNFTSVLQNFLPNQTLFLQYTGANLAVGSFIFVAVPLYLFNKEIPVSERMASALMLIVLTLSLNCNYLDYLWHGLHFPNQLPGRWTFLFSLFVVMIGCKGLLNAYKLSFAHGMGACLGGIALYYVVSMGLGDAEPSELPASAWIPVVAITLLVYALCYLIPVLKKRLDARAAAAENADKPVSASWKRDPRKIASFVFAVLTAVIMVVDQGKNFVTVSQYEGVNGLQVANEASYTDQLLRASRNGKTWKCGDDEFYRVEANNGFTFNCSMIGNYHGMRYYSSTMNGDVYSLLRYLGNRVYADKVSSVYTLSSPVQNSLFGLKYFMDFDRYLDYILPGTVIVDEDEDGLYRENTTALPIAYAVSDDILDFQVTDEIRAIRSQNDLVNKMCGEEVNVFRKQEPTSFITENVTLDESEDWNTNFFYLDSGQTQAAFHYSYTLTEGGCLFLEHNFRAGSLHVTGPNLDRTITPGDGGFAYVGRLSAGDTLNVDVTVENIGIGCFGVDLYTMDEAIWDSAFHKLDDAGLQVTSFKNTVIKGNINYAEPSLLFTSIPNDSGWSAYCDGKKLTLTETCGALLAVRVPAGEHEITFRYHVPGFAVGLTITVIGVLLTLVLCCKKWKKLPGKQTENDTAVTVDEASAEKVQADTVSDGETKPTDAALTAPEENAEPAEKNTGQEKI